MKNLKATKLALLIAVLSGGAMSSAVHAADQDMTDAGRGFGGKSTETTESMEGAAPSPYGSEDSVPNDEFLADESVTPGQLPDASRPETDMTSDEPASMRASDSSLSTSDSLQSDSDDQYSLESTSGEESHQVHFAFDSDELSEEALGSLDELAKELKDEDRPITLSISGYTDDTGPEEYNKDLAERRAKAVREYFKEKEIKVSNWEMDAPGEQNPVASNESREGRQENRRVEIDLMSEDQEVSVVSD